MSKEAAVIRYRAAITVFKKWLAEGIISNEEFAQIETVIARKYGLSFGSIYR